MFFFFFFSSRLFCMCFDVCCLLTSPCSNWSFFLMVEGGVQQFSQREHHESESYLRYFEIIRIVSSR